MAYPTADGQPQLSGSYIPILYATMLLIEFYKTTVFGAIATTEHEDQLKKFGDTLRIRTLPDIIVQDYVKGQEGIEATEMERFRSDVRAGAIGQVGLRIGSRDGAEVSDRFGIAQSASSP